MEEYTLGAVGVDFGRILNDDSEFLLEVSDLHLRDCDHVRTNPAEVGGLDLAVIVSFESYLLDTVSVTLQMFSVLRIVGPFCKLNFVYYVFPTLCRLCDRNAGQLDFVYFQLVVLSEHSDKGLFVGWGTMKQLDGLHCVEL